jgi:hypothetical protein
MPNGRVQTLINEFEKQISQNPIREQDVTLMDEQSDSARAPSTPKNPSKLTRLPSLSPDTDKTVKAQHRPSFLSHLSQSAFKPDDEIFLGKKIFQERKTALERFFSKYLGSKSLPLKGPQRQSPDCTQDFPQTYQDEKLSPTGSNQSRPPEMTGATNTGDSLLNPTVKKAQAKETPSPKSTSSQSALPKIMLSNLPAIFSILTVSAGSYALGAPLSIVCSIGGLALSYTFYNAFQRCSAAFKPNADSKPPPATKKNNHNPIRAEQNHPPTHKNKKPMRQAGKNVMSGK